MDKIDMLVELFPDLDELFEELDIEITDVITILIRGGHVKIPEYVEVIDV